MGYPSQKGKDGMFYDLVDPKSRDLKASIRSAILEAYKVYS
ncbi:MAG: hypothetical protein F3740_05380 [Nitrospinae bacterium]|nr:hypothetical protein [Nitrospinota bacterium]